MNKLKISRAGTPDLSNISHLPIGIHGRRPGSKLEAQSDCHYYNPVTSTHFSSRPPVEYPGSRPPIEYPGSQHESQQSYSQAVLTQSQNSQQISQQSGEGAGLPTYSWWNGSRGRHLMNKRPRSPNHEARPTPVALNSKDGRSDLSLTSQLTAQTLLQQISNRQGPTGKCTLTELMEQRLMEIQNCLNGMVKRLDELQDELRENFSSVKANVQDAARDAGITRKEATLQRFQLEELSDEQKKITTRIAEQITELKVELLQSQKTELQCILSERKLIAEIIPVEYEDQRIDPGKCDGFITVSTRISKGKRRVMRGLSTIACACPSFMKSPDKCATKHVRN